MIDIDREIHGKELWGLLVQYNLGACDFRIGQVLTPNNHTRHVHSTVQCDSSFCSSVHLHWVWLALALWAWDHLVSPDAPLGYLVYFIYTVEFCRYSPQVRAVRRAWNAHNTINIHGPLGSRFVTQTVTVLQGSGGLTWVVMVSTEPSHSPSDPYSHVPTEFWKPNMSRQSSWHLQCWH